MALTKEQQKELDLLSKHLNKIEKFALDNKIDLDVFISDYNEEGYSVYATEKVSLEEKGNARKAAFEGSSRGKSAKSVQKAR